MSDRPAANEPNNSPPESGGMAKVRKLADEFQNPRLQSSHGERTIADVDAKIDVLRRDLEVRVDRISTNIEGSIKSAIGESFGIICTAISEINQRIGNLEHRSDLLDGKLSENMDEIRDKVKALEQRMGSVERKSDSWDRPPFGSYLAIEALEQRADAIERKLEPGPSLQGNARKLPSGRGTYGSGRG